MKRFVAIALALLLVTAALPMSVLAQSGVELPIVELDDVKYEWADNYTTCTATFGEGDAAKSETVQTQITDRIPATCTTPEKTVYTATFTDPDFETQTKEVPNGTALGHVWGEVSYVWAGDNSTCTATRTCATDTSHVETETATAASQVTTPAGCTAAGTTTYTATFTNAAFTQQTKSVDDIPATGHDLGEVTYTWSDDNKTCTASATCAHCGEVTETVNTTSVVTVEPTEEASGTRTYTATFTTPGFETQTKDVEEAYVAFIWGDADGNGKVNNRDIVRLKNYLANYDDDTETSTVEIFPGADADGNGKVNNRDIVRLKNYLANYDDDTETSTVILGPAT